MHSSSGLDSIMISLFDRVPDESFMSCAENVHFGFSLEGRKTFFSISG